MKVHDENKYESIWDSLDQLSPAAAFVVTIIHMGKVLSEMGETEIFREQQLSVDEFEALFIIKNDHPCRPKDIVDNSVMQPAKITRVLDKLDEKGLIRRIPDPQDRRSYSVEMTEEGEQRLKNAEQAFVDSTQPMLKKMGRPAVKALNEVLRNILINLGDMK